MPALDQARRLVERGAASTRAARAGSADRARPSSPCRSSRGCPTRSAASKIASVWCTVPMSRIAVVPPSSSSAHASSALARRRVLVERGLVGPDHVAQPVEQLEVVGAAARERLAGVDVRLDEARHHHAAGAVDDLVVARSAACTRRRRGRSRRRRHATSPASTRCSGSIVRIVPPRKISSLIARSRQLSAVEAVGEQLRRGSTSGARPSG